ncbi:MAG: hypothetical protein ACYC9X_00745 [Dehalococcoidia bacterium]
MRIMILVSMVCACASFKPSLRADEETCASSALFATVVAARPAVEAILLSSGEDWRAGLAVKAVDIGEQAVLCATAAIVHDYAPVTQAPATNPRIVAMQTAVWRAKSYVDAKTATPSGA